MTPETALDRTARARDADPENAGARMRFYERLLDAELFLLLAEEPVADRVRPQVFALDEGQFVLAFDLNARLSAFLDAPAPYAAMPGRRLVEMLAGQGLGVALNPGVAVSETLIPVEAVAWMAETGGAAPGEVEEKPVEITAPDAPLTLIEAIAGKLPAIAAASVWLAGARYADGTRRLLLALVDVPGAAREAVAQAMSESVRFSGVEAALDIVMLEADAPTLPAIRRVGIGFGMPEHVVAKPVRRQAPGSDPEKPPILRR